jgi:hypothetical protein
MGTWSIVRSRVIATTALTVAAAAAATPAAAQLPRIGVADGVRIAPSGARLTLTLRAGGPVYPAVRGRRLAVRCFRVSAFPAGPAIGESVGQTVSVPRGRHRLRLALPASPLPSFCQLKSTAGRELAVVALTHDGAVWLDERATATAIQAVVTGAALLADDRGGTAWPSAADIVGATKGGVSVLDAPDAPAPPTGVGVYSDGARHLRVSARSSLGRELYLEYRDDALISNAVPYLEFE